MHASLFHTVSPPLAEWIERELRALLQTDDVTIIRGCALCLFPAHSACCAGLWWHCTGFPGWLQAAALLALVSKARKGVKTPLKLACCVLSCLAAAL